MSNRQQTDEPVENRSIVVIIGVAGPHIVAKRDENIAWFTRE